MRHNFILDLIIISWFKRGAVEKFMIITLSEINYSSMKTEEGQLRIFFGHNEVQKRTIMKFAEMKEAQRIKASPMHPNEIETWLCNMITDKISEAVQMHGAITQIIYIGDINIGRGGQSAHAFFYNNRLEEELKIKLANGAEPIPTIMKKILYSASPYVITEVADKGWKSENVITMVTPLAKEKFQAKLAFEMEPMSPSPRPR